MPGTTMPGMGANPLSDVNSLVTAAFQHQVFVTSLLWIIAIAFLVMVYSVASRRVLSFNLSAPGLAEARARTYLRLGFGALWVFDGILQFQVAMPLGLANSVVAPATAGTPGWLQHLMTYGITMWNSHSLTLASATAWIQVGIGLLLLASNGSAGRVAAAISVGWGSMVWLVGNGAGGIFQSSSSILFGWPGAPLFYVIAGVFLALSPKNFPERFSRVTLRLISVVLGIGLVLQILPSRGFWHGGDANALTTMTTSMVTTAQPHWLAYIVSKFGALAGTMGGGFNLLIIFWLAITAVGLWMAPHRHWRWPVRSLVAGAVILWVGAQDLAIFGGMATDVNTMIPLALLTACASPGVAQRLPLARRLPRELRSSSGAVVASFAAGMLAFSVGSMGWASVASAENTLYLAQNGTASAVNTQAPGFTATDQSGATYHLGEHAGHYTLLTFLDPVCWTDCPLLAGQLKSVGATFGSSAPLDLVAVAANPRHETMANVRHFVAQHHLGGVKNLHFVTGALSKLAAIWNAYGIQVTSTASSVMSVHSDLMFIISPEGRIRWIIPDDPIFQKFLTASGQSSAESELITLLHRAGLH